MDTRSQKEADALSFASGWNTEKHVPSFIVGPPSSSRADISLNAAMSTCPEGFEGRLCHQDLDQKLDGGGTDNDELPSIQNERRQPGFRHEAGFPDLSSATHSVDPGVSSDRCFVTNPPPVKEDSGRLLVQANGQRSKSFKPKIEELVIENCSPRRRSTGEGGRVVLTLET